MGNVLSDEEEDRPDQFLEPGFNLESPDADNKINYGTAAPNCQPKHTTASLQQQQEKQQLDNNNDHNNDNDDDSS